MATDKKGCFEARTMNNMGAEVLYYDAIGKNSEAFTIGDPVQFISGQLAVAGTTTQVVGVVVQTVTMASNNVGGANVAPAYIPADEGTIFRMTCNADLTNNATDVGTYYKLTANTTNTVQVDVASGVQTGANRVVEIKKVDPDGIGGTGAGNGLRQVEVIFLKTDNRNINITA